MASPSTSELVNDICSTIVGGDSHENPFMFVNYSDYPLGVASMCVYIYINNRLCVKDY